MVRIEGFRVQNYRALKDIKLGKLASDWSSIELRPLTPLTVVIGKNGAGKSTLFDAFGFLADSLREGVEDACNKGQRGGFDRLVSPGKREIKFEIYYRQAAKERPITYELTIAKNDKGRVIVRSEQLRQRRKHQTKGQPFSFLQLQDGRGVAWQKGLEEQERDIGDRVEVKMTHKEHLGVATLGGLADHPRIAKFRQFLEGWYLSYFTPDAARDIPLAGPQKRLSARGDNLGNVVQYMEREHGAKFNEILQKISEKIPGIEKINTQPLGDGRLGLQFNDRGFEDPFYAQQMSDGTLKIFSYLLMLEDPNPPSFMCVEEPENGLYHKLLDILANEFRARADTSAGPQVFITTHQPYFVNALNPDEVWVLDKKSDGYSTIFRVSDRAIVKNLVEEKFLLGHLWNSDYLDEEN